MSDQCRTCVLRGDRAKCEAEDCDKHLDWYSLALKYEIAYLRLALRIVSGEHSICGTGETPEQIFSGAIAQARLDGGGQVTNQKRWARIRNRRTT